MHARSDMSRSSCGRSSTAGGCLPRASSDRACRMYATPLAADGRVAGWVTAGVRVTCSRQPLQPPARHPVAGIPDVGRIDGRTNVDSGLCLLFTDATGSDVLIPGAGCQDHCQGPSSNASSCFFPCRNASRTYKVSPYMQGKTNLQLWFLLFPTFQYIMSLLHIECLSSRHPQPSPAPFATNIPLDQVSPPSSAVIDLRTRSMQPSYSISG